MSVKTTRHLTREEAEDFYVRLAVDSPVFRQRIRAHIAAYPDNVLEDVMERLNDEAHGGEGFENYSITAGA